MTLTTAVSTRVGEVDLTIVWSRPEWRRTSIKDSAVGNQFDTLLCPFTHCGWRLSQSGATE